jgi:hypothetical protein
MSNASLEQRVARLEAALAQLTDQQPSPPAKLTGWKRMVGVFADNPHFEAAVVLGREYRESLVENDDENSMLDESQN